jgi:hypothetical protein
MRQIGVKTLFAVLLLVIPAAASAAAQDGAAILKKVDANLQPESFESYR